MRAALPLRMIDDSRTRRVAELLIVLCVLSLADLIFTVWAQLFPPSNSGPFLELNPLARHFLIHNAIFSLVCLKVMLTGVGAAIFWHLRKFWRAELALWAIVGVYVMLTFRWNTYTLEVVAMVQ